MTPVLLAAYFNRPKMTSFLLNDLQKTWAALKPSFGAGAEEVENYLAFESHDRGQRTAYHYAIMKNSVDVLKVLLEFDRKKNHGKPLTDHLFNKCADNGWTPLMYAAFSNQSECVKTLLSAGVPVDFVDPKRGWTALHYAAHKNSLASVQVLLQFMNRSQVNLGSKHFHQTALMVASNLGNKDIVEALLKDGKCETSIKDSAGESALHYAARTADTHCVDLLFNADEAVAAEESGVGFTVFDTIMQVLRSKLRGESVAVEQADAVAIYKKLKSSDSAKRRKLASLQDVRNVVEVMISNALSNSSSLSVNVEEAPQVVIQMSEFTQ